MKNILIIAKMSLFQNENSPNRYYFLKYLEQKPNIGVLNDVSSNSIIQWIQINGKPDIIIYYFLSKGVSLINIDLPDFLSSKQKYNIPCAMIFEDSHYTEIVNNLYNKYNFDYFIQLGYNKSVINKLLYYKIPYKLWNQYIDTTKFINHIHDNTEKKYDFLFYGYTNPKIYPLREKIYKVLKQLQTTHKHIRIKIIEHGSYKKNILQLPTRENLSVLLSESRFSFATSSKYDLFIKKYIEIPLSGATVIGNIPTNYKDLLKNNIITMDIDASLLKIKQIILDAYNKKYIYIERNNNKFSQLLGAKYNYKRGYMDLNNIVSNILVYTSRWNTILNNTLFNPILNTNPKPVLKQRKKQEKKPDLKQRNKPVLKQRNKLEKKPVLKQRNKPEKKLNNEYLSYRKKSVTFGFK